MAIKDVRYWQGELSAQSGYEAWLYIDDGEGIIDIVDEVEDWSGKQVRITVEIVKP